MSVIHRQKNYTDYDMGGANRKRKIGNHVNFVDHQGNWGETISNITSQASEPPAWSGNYDFDRASLNAPMQFFARDAQDAGNRAMVGIRLSDRPQFWMNLKAHNIDNAVDVTDVSNTVVQWTGLWTDTNYRIQHLRHKIKVDFVLTGENHPASFTETIQLGGGMTLVDNGNNTISVMNGEEEVFVMPTPYGYLESDDTQAQVVACTMVVGEKVAGRDTIVVTPNADDLTSVGYAENIVIDPTATISGTSAIEDSQLSQVGNLNNNYGGSVLLSNKDTSGIESRPIFRITDGNFPEGTITDFKWIMRAGLTVETFSGEVYKFKPANNWVEGTTNGTAPEIGANCWTFLAYDASSPTNWAGSAGAGTSGTDYFADVSPPILSGDTTAVGDPLTTTLPTAWVTDWRDTPSNNQGFIVNPTGGSTNGRMGSTENSNSATHPTFEIDYTAGGGSVPKTIMY